MKDSMIPTRKAQALGDLQLMQFDTAHLIPACMAASWTKMTSHEVRTFSFAEHFKNFAEEHPHLSYGLCFIGMPLALIAAVAGAVSAVILPISLWMGWI